MGRKGGLGKGLDSLIPDLGNFNNTAAETVETGSAQEEQALDTKLTPVRRNRTKNTEQKAKEEPKERLEVKISLVEPNKDQPRKNFDEDALEELAESIKLHGIIQPIVVVKKDAHYEIVTGERRWRAAKIAGLKNVPVIVKEFSEQDIMEISLIENIQRENLNPIEEAMAYQRLAREFHLKQDEIAKRVGKGRAVISNTVRLLKLDEEVQKMVVAGSVSSGHARALLALESKDEQYDLATRIVEEGLSVREVEEIVRTINEPTPEKEEGATDKENKEDEQVKLYYEKYESILRNLMGTKVNIKKKKNDRGKIEIEYYSMDELERLLSLLQNCE